MNKLDSFLHIKNINSSSKEQLLTMRKVLLDSVIKNSQQEERKGMYMACLVVFSEFERLTKHILESEIVNN